MRSFSVLFAFLSALVTTSYAFPSFNSIGLEVRKDHNGTRDNRGNGGDTTKKACKQIQKLTYLTTLAANQTKLDELVAKGKMNTTEVDGLKIKAAEATTMLQTLESNSTLTSECAVIQAAQQTKSDCRAMKQLQQLTSLASNQTAMDAFVSKKSLNSTQVDKLKERITKAETMFQTLSSNTTLTDFCATLKQGNGNNSTDGTAVAKSSSDSTTAQQTSSNAAMNQGMTLAGLSVILFPALAVVFIVGL
ncbi:hypothetical protein ACN47E_005723 [Coniothyrium glycines]